MKRRLLTGLGAALLAVPLVCEAQDKPHTTETAESDDQAGLAAFVDSFPAPEPLTAEQAARLPQALALAETVLPRGVLRSVTGGTFDALFTPPGEGSGAGDARSVIDRRLGMADSPVELTDDQAARIAAMLDPAWEERERRVRAFSADSANRVMDTVEPLVRQAFAELYAINFSVAELGEIQAFFATPTGAAYAQRSYQMASDPRLSRAIMTMLPAAMAQIEGLRAEAEAAVADLPPPRNYADLNSGQRKLLARLLGTAEEDLPYTLVDGNAAGF